MLEHLRSLAVFAQVVELGSFRAAARSLSLSPSVVSHHVSELETRLAVPLLYRSTRRLALTPDGAKLIASAREMVAAAERGLDAVSGQSESPSGALRVTAPAFLADTPLSRDLAAFSAACPRVMLTVSFSDTPRDLLRDGFDIALRIGSLSDSTHKTRRLADMRRLLVGAPRYVNAHPPVRTPQSLAALDIVHLSTRPREMRFISNKQKRPVTHAYTPKVAVDSAAAIRELVLSGAGVAALPEVTIHADLASGRLLSLLPQWRLALLGVHAVWPANAQRAELTSRFLAFMGPRVTTLFAPHPG